MTDIVQVLRHVIQRFLEAIEKIDEPEFSAKPLPGKWSKKEIVGHLIDSAQNNLRRFICGQYETTPPHVVYDQDFWVAANAYQQMSRAEILLLWRLINERICAVLETMPKDRYERLCAMGSHAPEAHTLEWVATDYVRHMKHHLDQIIRNFSATMCS